MKKSMFGKNPTQGFTPSLLHGYPFVFTSFALFTALLLCASIQAQSPQAPPTFRGGVDLRQLDVTVQDKNRQPVRGLTAADFRIEEEGQPRRSRPSHSLTCPMSFRPNQPGRARRFQTWFRTVSRAPASLRSSSTM